jgi:hypothetical protein
VEFLCLVSTLASTALLVKSVVSPTEVLRSLSGLLAFSYCSAPCKSIRLPIQTLGQVLWHVLLGVSYGAPPWPVYSHAMRG